MEDLFMNDEVQSYMIKYSDEIQSLFLKVRRIVMQSVPCELEEKMWAKLPSYYLGKKFIRIIPFKDHLNIEAKAVTEYSEILKQYNITPKGMLQITLDKEITEDILKTVFNKTLTE
jgi:poly(A) polymerase Pap1